MAKRENKIRYYIAAIIVISLIIFLCGIELFFYVYNKRHIVYFKPVAPPPHIIKDKVKLLFEDKSFDPYVGWGTNPPIKTEIKNRSLLVAQAYGDSVTYCTDVTSDETWESQYAKMTGYYIANMGVSAYGLDQAVLKYERYGAPLKTKYVILGLFRRLYERLRLYQMYYYFPDESYYVWFKPIFILKNNRYELIPAPCDNQQCLYDLLVSNPQWLHDFLMQHDDYYIYFQSLPLNRFPHTLAFIRDLPTIFPSLSKRPDHIINKFFRENYCLNEKTIPLVKFLIDRFVEDCKKNGSQPVFLLLYTPYDLKLIKQGKRPDSLIIDYLKSNNLSYVDTGAYILQNWKTHNNFEELLAPPDHMNATGNRLIAEALVTSRILTP